MKFMEQFINRDIKMKEYVKLFWASDLKKKPGFEHYKYYDDFDHVLIKLNKFGEPTPGGEIAIDGGEPEDQSFLRDWSWVPELINEYENTIAELKDEIKRLKGM